MLNRIEGGEVMLYGTSTLAIEWLQAFRSDTEIQYEDKNWRIASFQNDPSTFMTTFFLYRKP